MVYVCVYMESMCTYVRTWKVCVHMCVHGKYVYICVYMESMCTYVCTWEVCTKYSRRLMLMLYLSSIHLLLLSQIGSSQMPSVMATTTHPIPFIPT